MARAPSEIHTFPDSRDLAWSIANSLGRLDSLHAVDVHHFPDGESLVRVDSRGPRRAVLVRSLAHPNPKLLELLFAADALHRAGVEELTLVAPYLGYMRQDAVFRRGEALSQQVVAELLSNAFERIQTVEAHVHRIADLADVFRCPAESIPAAPAIADWCATLSGSWVVVGPDAESLPWVRDVATLAGLPYLVCKKERHGDRDVRISLPSRPPRPNALIVDDIASSGATLASAARALRAEGVRTCEAVVAHAIMSPDAEARARCAGIDRITSTNSISHATNGIDLGPLLAGALQGPAGIAAESS